MEQNLWILIVAVLTGGILVLAGSLLAGWLVYKTSRDGAPLFTPKSGSIEYSDIPGAEVFEKEPDPLAEMETAHNEEFLASLHTGGIK